MDDMRFSMPDGREFSLTDSGREQFRVDYGRTLLAEAEAMYRMGRRAEGDARCLLIAACGAEVKALTEKAMRIAVVVDKAMDDAIALAAKYASTSLLS